jgi:hypothetical protein
VSVREKKFYIIDTWCLADSGRQMSILKLSSRNTTDPLFKKEEKKIPSFKLLLTLFFSFNLNLLFYYQNDVAYFKYKNPPSFSDIEIPVFLSQKSLKCK